MLLFLLSIYLHQDLLNSEEINSAKFNEALIIDKHHQNLLQAKSLLRDLEQGFKEMSVLVEDNYKNYELVLQTVKNDQKHQITKDPTKPPAEFLPSLQNNPYVPHIGLSPNYLGSHAPPSFTAQPPFPDSRLPVTLKHPELRSYVPHLSPTPFFPGSHAPPSVIAKPPSPDPTPPVTLKHPALRLDLLNPRNSKYPGLMAPRSLLSINGPGHYIARLSYSPTSSRTTSNRPQVFYKEPPIKVHFRDENPHELKTFSPAISPSFTLSSKTPPRSTTPSRTVDENAKIWQEKIAAYIRDKKILKVTASSQSRGRSIMPASPRIALATAQGEAEEPRTAKTASFTFPETTMETTHDPENNLMTMVGDVLSGRIVVQSPNQTKTKTNYKHEMEELKEGYLMFFFIEMSRLISLKNTTVVIKAVQNMENIYNQKYKDGEISWIQEPLLTVIPNLLRLPPEKYAVTLLKAQCSMMFNMLLERKTVLSREVNALISHAETIFEGQNGERLLNATRDFEAYPNTKKTLYEICDDLLTNLIDPFQREAEHQKFYPVLKNVNKALIDRFPELPSHEQQETHAYEETTIIHEGYEIHIPKRRRNHHIKKQKRKAPPGQLYDMNM